MPIKIKHAPSAAALGGTAYTIGRGQRIERDYRFATEVGLKQQGLNIQAASVALQAKARAGQLALGYEQLGSREEQQASRDEQWQDEFDFRKQQQQQEMGLKLQSRLDAKEIYDREHTVTDYTPKQLKRLEHYDNLQATAEQEFAEGKWTAVQLEEITRKNNHLKDLVIPQTRLMTEMTPKQLLASKFQIRNGIEYMEQANGDWEPTGSSFAEKAKLYTDIFKVMDARQDTDGNAIPVDEHELDKRFLGALTRFRQIDELASRVEDEQKRRDQQGPSPSAEEQANKQAAIEKLPVMFDTIIKGQPKIGRKKKGKPSLFADDVYGEEAYNKMLIEAVGRGEQEGIPPDVVKAELDKWWDAQHDKERGQRFQKFGNRFEFEGAAPASQEEFIRTIQGMDDKKKAKAYYDKWASKWR